MLVSTWHLTMQWGRRHRRAKTQPGLTTSSPGYSRQWLPGATVPLCNSNPLLFPPQFAHESESTPQLEMKGSQNKRYFIEFHQHACRLRCFTLILRYPTKYLTEREGVEAQARQSHATTKAGQAEEGEGGRESSTCSWHCHQQVRNDQEHASTISRSQVDLQRVTSDYWIS